MTRPSGELLQALGALRRAVEASFTGNGYYLTANQVTELGELLGWDAGDPPPLDGAELGFAAALDALRKLIEAELADNRFYAVAHKLDVLAYLGARLSSEGGTAGTAKAPDGKAVEPAPRQGEGAAAPLSPQAQAGAPNGAAKEPEAFHAPENGARTFDELATAAKARVEAVSDEILSASIANGACAAHEGAEEPAQAAVREAAAPEPQAGRPSGELLQALWALRRAVEAGFTGNSYYLAANQVAELGELLGCSVGDRPQLDSEALGVGPALHTLRERVEAELADNRFYAVAHKLDVLSYLAAHQSSDGGVAKAPVVEAAEPAPLADAPQQSEGAEPLPSPQAAPVEAEAAFAPGDGTRSFDELAAAAKARIEEIVHALSAPIDNADESAGQQALEIAQAPAQEAKAIEAEPQTALPSGELLQAFGALRRAVEASFTGNGYYSAASQVTELGELLGCGAGDPPPSDGAELDFGPALDALRKRVEAELVDARFYLAAHKLDALAYLGARLSVDGEIAKTPEEKTAQPAPLAQAAQQGEGAAAPLSPQAVAGEAEASVALENGARSFDELATAAKTRVEEAAEVFAAPVAAAESASHEIAEEPVLEVASAPELEVETIAEEPEAEPNGSDLAGAPEHQNYGAPGAYEPLTAKERAGAHSAAAQPETLADGELERRSSEPCSMGEIAPIAVDEMEAASVPAEASSAAGAAEPSLDLGSPPAQVERGCGCGESSGAPAEEEALAGALRSAEAAHDSASAAAGQTLAAKPEEPTKPEPRPAQQKPFHVLWLDMLFGRKR